MRKQELPFINEFYADDARPWSQQDVVNWLPCAAESPGTRTPTMLKTPPGLSPFVELTNVNDPVRSVYVAEGRLLTVVGDTFSQIATDGTPGTLGTVPGVGRVRMAHNQISGGNQIVVVNGSAGFVYNTVTDLFAPITDAGYPGAIDAVFIDGFIVQIEPARRYAFSSAPADATEYNTLDRFTSEVSPDLLVGMAVSNNELLLLSESTGEFFYNSGAAQQPFRTKRISFQKGCAGRYTVAVMDNTVYWLGDDGAFYMLDGYSPRRISNRPIEQAIRGLNWSQAFAMVWEDAGHSVCYWTFPDGLTFGFDASQRKWHRRASYELSRWRVNDLAFWQQRWIAGDFQYGRLWELDWDYIREGNQEFISEATGPVLSDHQNLVKMPRLEFILDTGQPETEIRTFGALQITGDLPDGIVGEDVSYAYTVTGGWPPYLVEIIAGSLPPGLTMNTAGLITGTFTTAGSYSWTVMVTDAEGDTDTLDDTCDVSEFVWWLTIVGEPQNLWTSTDPVTWPNGPYIRTPNVVPFFGPMQTDASVLIVDSNAGDCEYITDYTPAGGLSTTIVSIVAGAIRDPISIDTVVFAADLTGQYFLSLDAGQTWTPYASPGGAGNDVLGLARLDSGRWICATHGAPRQAFYTDAAIPNTGWTPGGDPGNGERLISSGTAVINWRDGAAEYGRTTTGTSWALLDPGFTPTSEYGTYMDGVFVCSGAAGNIARSTDDGLTWTQVALPAGTAINWISSGGRHVVVNIDNLLMVSDDLGLTWTQSTLPLAGTSRAAVILTPP